MSETVNNAPLPLATEMMRELKAQSKRWFIAFIVVLAGWIITIGAFAWYITLPTEEYAVDVENKNGTANYIGNDLNGELYNGQNQSNLQTESYESP